MAITALQGLLKTMCTALGQPRLLGKMAHALCTRVTKRLENPQTFLPKSHVGLVLQRVAELSPEFSSSAYLTDTQLSRLKRVPEGASIAVGPISLPIAIPKFLFKAVPGLTGRHYFFLRDVLQEADRVHHLSPHLSRFFQDSNLARRCINSGRMVLNDRLSAIDWIRRKLLKCQELENEIGQMSERTQGMLSEEAQLMLERRKAREGQPLGIVKDSIRLPS